MIAAMTVATHVLRLAPRIGTMCVLRLALKTGTHRVLKAAAMPALNVATKPHRPAQRARALMKRAMPSRAAQPQLVLVQRLVPKVALMAAPMASAARVRYRDLPRPAIDFE